MTILAGNLNRRPRFIVEITIAVGVLAEMAIHAMHSLFQVNVVQMDALLKLVRIIKRDNVALCVQKVTFSITLEDFAKHPAVAMKVGKLYVLQFCIESRGAGLHQEAQFRPE